MKTAIVILNWNGKEHLAKYLPSVFQFTDLGQCDIYVADNGSSDGSVDFVSSEFPQIKIIELSENFGFAGGYNRALKQIDADIFCLLNSDVRVSKKWLEPILTTFEQDQEVAAIQPKILSDRDWSRFEHAGAAGGFIDKYGYPFCRGRIMDIIEFDRGQYNKNTDVFWASGACLFIRAKLFLELGGFDDDYFAHMEEIDLCWRLKNQGHRIMFNHKSKVYHYGGATLEYNNPRKLFLNFRNSLWTLYKNYTGPNLWWIIFRRMLIDTLAIVKFVVSLDLKNAAAVIKAHFAYYNSKTQLRKKRRLLKDKVVQKKHPEMLQSSIIMQFFLKAKKTFAMMDHFHYSIIKAANRR